MAVFARPDWLAKSDAENLGFDPYQTDREKVAQQATKASASKIERNTKQKPRWPDAAALCKGYAAPGQLNIKGVKIGRR